jgi:hypothetical protein
MNNSKIEIELELSDNKKYCLILTPKDYKEEFKIFIRQNNINPTDAYYIKNLIQAKMINLYKGYKLQMIKKSMNDL